MSSPEMANQPTSFQKLPAEMLSYIFEECVEEDEREPGIIGLGVSPWLLALVCRFWYQTAKGTPSLWRKILVTDYCNCYWSLMRHTGRGLSAHQYSSQPDRARLHSAMQVCVNPTEVSNALKRSGAASLEITICFGGEFGQSRIRLNSSSFQEFYSTVFNERVSPRIARLVFETKSEFGGGWEWWSGEELKSVTVPNSTFPNLISLEIHSQAPLCTKLADGTTLLKGILESARKLRDLRLGTGPVPDELKYSIWRSSSYATTVPNLREIRVHSGGYLDEIFGKFSGVEKLVIDGAARVAKEKEEWVWDVKTTAWPIQSTPEITFERLIRLHLILDDFSLLDKLSLPLLEELRLTQSYQPQSLLHRNPNGYPPRHPDFILELPSLLVLRVRSPNITPLNRFDMPQLKGLHVTSTRLAQGKADADFAAFVSGPASSSGTATIAAFIGGVQDLYVNAMMSEKGTISTLKAFHSLQTLHLVPGKKMGKSVIQELSMTKHKRDMAVVLCTELTRIDIDCHSFWEWNKTERRNKMVGTTMPEGLPAALEKLVTSRKKWGKQLEHCILTTKDGTKRDYVKG